MTQRQKTLETFVRCFSLFNLSSFSIYFSRKLQNSDDNDDDEQQLSSFFGFFGLKKKNYASFNFTFIWTHTPKYVEINDDVVVGLLLKKSKIYNNSSLKPDIQRIQRVKQV